MTSRFRVSMAQINTTVGDFEGNTRKIIERLEEAQALGADVVTFPELAITGYPPEDLLIKVDFVRENLACLDAIARHAIRTAAVVGFVDSGDHLYNAAAVLHDGRIAGVYHKMRLPNYGVFDEKRYFQPGSESPVFVIHGVPVAVNICEDVWAPGGPLLAQSLAGALISLTLNSSPYSAQKWRIREEMLKTRARDYAVALAYNNLVGGQDELVFDGLSVMIDAAGRVAARGPAFEEALVTADLDIDAIRASRRYARDLARTLGIELLDLPIDPAAAAYEQVLAAPFGGRPRDVTEENLQARIRGNLLMALSNKMGWLVLTTGNKSEMSVGYATLYGDMAGGFAVIKDVPKTLVYTLARWRNGRDVLARAAGTGGPPIPNGVLERAPTAELRENQTDQDTLPPYEILDGILQLYVEDDRSPDEIAAQGFDPQVVARVIAMVDRSEYKRRQAPPGIKITPKAFGKDRRLPITNWYRGRRVVEAPSRPPVS